MTPEQEARIRALADELSEVRGGSVHFRAQEAKRYGKDLTALLAEVNRLRESAAVWMNALHTACVIVGADTCAGSPSECLEAIRTATSPEPKGESND